MLLPRRDLGGGGEGEAFKVWLTKVTEKDLGFQLDQINGNVTAQCTVKWHILIGKEQRKYGGGRKGRREVSRQRKENTQCPGKLAAKI